MGKLYAHLYFSEGRGYVIEPYTDSPNTIGSIKAMCPPHTFRLPPDTGAGALGEALAGAHSDAVAGVPSEEPGFRFKELVRFAGA